MSDASSIGDVLALYDTEQRRDVRYADSVREVTPAVVRHTSRLGGRGFVIYWKLTEADVEPVAREQIQHYRSLGQDFEWKVYDHDAPPDLGARLEQLGFEPEPREAIVYFDLSMRPAWLANPVSARVERVTDPNAVEEIIVLRRSVLDEDLAHLASSLKAQLQGDAAHFGLYVVRADGKVVSAGWARFDENTSFASLWGGTTDPAWRHRGLYTALVAARASEALRRGYRFLTVDALPTSRPILEKLGFKVLTHACGYVWK
ncbi:MAG: GNAT family N-acetyltransferase, partial [Candidatus Eremiobacteraeota bacterium]|nr:GNAT family N-acetyltransferase [Candidatus Eremiobacteraeota bacterium]